MPLPPQRPEHRAFVPAARRRQSNGAGFHPINVYNDNSAAATATSPRPPSGGYQQPLEQQLLSRQNTSGVTRDLENLSVMDEEEYGRTPNNTQQEAPAVPAMMASGGRGSPAPSGLCVSRSPSVLGGRDPRADDFLKTMNGGREVRFASEEGEIIEYTPEAERAASEARTSWPTVPEFAKGGLVFPKDQQPRARPAQAPGRQQREEAVVESSRQAVAGAQPITTTTPQQANAGTPEPPTATNSFTLENEPRRNSPRGPRRSYPKDLDDNGLSQEAQMFLRKAQKASRKQEVNDPDFAETQTPQNDVEDEDIESESQTLDGEVEIISATSNAMPAKPGSPITPSRKRPSLSPERPRTGSSSKKVKSGRTTPPKQEKLRVYRYEGLSDVGRHERDQVNNLIYEEWQLDLWQAIPEDLWILDSTLKLPTSPRDWSTPVYRAIYELACLTTGRYEIAVAALREAVARRSGSRRLELFSDIRAAADMVGDWSNNAMDVDIPMQDSSDDTLAEALQQAAADQHARQARGRSAAQTEPMRHDSGRSTSPMLVKKEETVLPSSISRNILLTQVEAQDISALDGDAFIRLYGLVEDEMRRRKSRMPSGHSENPYVLD